jgi:hypothetical protein
MHTQPRRDNSGRCLPGFLLLVAALSLCAAGMAARYGLSWPRRLLWPHPPGIVLHHSASPGNEGGEPVDAALIDQWHQRRGWGQSTASGSYHIGYHYVILPDGTVQPGRPEWMSGAHTRQHNDMLGVCLVGNFSSGANPAGRIQPARPTRAQLDSLQRLLLRLTKRYDLATSQIHRHRDLAQTACPGDRFPYEAVLHRLARAGVPSHASTTNRRLFGKS